MCYACVPGKYNNKKGQLSCTDCPEGQAVDVFKRTVCDDCPIGWYQDVSLVHFSSSQNTAAIDTGLTFHFHCLFSVLLLISIWHRLLHCHPFVLSSSLLLSFAFSMKLPKSTRPVRLDFGKNAMQPLFRWNLPI